MINAIPVILIAVAVIALGVSVWLLGGYLLDKYDQYRTDNWKGW